MFKNKENKLELGMIQKKYPKFYEYLDEVLLSQTEIYHYRQLYDIFDNLKYFITIEQEGNKIFYKIFPQTGFIKYKSGFEDRTSAELDAFEHLINLFETNQTKLL